MLWGIWISMLIAGVVLLVLSIFVALKLKLLDLLDEISGRKAKRQAKRLRELSEKSSFEDIKTEDVYSAIEDYTNASNDIKNTISSKEDIVTEDIGNHASENLDETTSSLESTSNLEEKSQQKEHKVVILEEQTSLPR